LNNPVHSGEAGTQAPAGGPISLQQAALLLHPDDDVAVAKTELQPGLELAEVPVAGAHERVRLRQAIPPGHKLALRNIRPGEPVHKYGHVIGIAAQAIGAGQHVHDHNLEVKTLAQDYAFGADARLVAPVPEAQRHSFKGYQRADGRVGTRNLIAIISSVHCSANACRRIARHFVAERLAPYPNVDGVIALTHGQGCGGEAEYRILRRTLAGMAKHPNVGAYVLVGLGCEGNQIADMVEQYGLTPCGSRTRGGQALVLGIQEQGGFARTVEAGIRTVVDLLPVVNAVQRTRQPLSALTLALQCGGSDGWSGITANPLVGLVVDRVVREGGRAVLSETPEVFGAEHLLTRRVASLEAGQRLVDKLRWWDEYVERQGIELDHNAGPGNRAGGISNIYEKSLGAIAKGGSTPVTAVLDHAEQVVDRGLVFMDGPGFDPISITGMVAGGCNLALFTTGRGSISGCEVAPVIKVCSNTATYERMMDDMDLNAGRVLQPEVGMDEVAGDLLSLILAVASGQATKSEAQVLGEGEFIPWNPEGTT
jgi:altronate hydrolase